MKKGMESMAGIARTVFTGALLSVSLLACQPRGESRTLEQVFSDARASFMGSSESVASDVRGDLTALTGKMDNLAGAGKGGGSVDTRALATDVATSLDGLMGKVGVTVRPAMAELISQYRAASADGGQSAGSAPLKLLVARTYMLLSAELRTSHFKG